MARAASRRTVRVHVDDESVLARWVDWQARGRSAPLAAMGAEGQHARLFVANEVLVDDEDADLVQELVRRYRATIVPPARVPPPPRGLGLRRSSRADEMPLPVRLRFSTPPRVSRATTQLEELVARHAGVRGNVTVTSSAAAAVASIAGRYAAEGRGIGLNVVGQTAELPLRTAPEGKDKEDEVQDAFQFAAFAGKSRIVQAWQLVESRRAMTSLSTPVWIAILDGGFWLDATGKPNAVAGQSSDFGFGHVQINLEDDAQSAGGSNPNKCGDSSCPWHGNGVASAAVAAVGNAAGAAGAGGTVALPAFFKTDLSLSQISTCLNYCAAWGLDVLNMSFSIEWWELFFPTSSWDKAFQWAADNGVVLVAAAGNDGEELPDHNVRPATRTPGVITVGALDANDQAAGFSNYGSSVTLWAPGVDVPVAPDQDNPFGSKRSGTSIASPIVAGVAAMMRAVDDSLNTIAIRQILANTGWPGTGRVNKGLDAYAAVFETMHRALPPELAEPNNTAATAAPLQVGPGGVLMPGISGIATRSTGNDADWWKFTLQDFSNVTILVEWYQRLSSIGLELVPDDPESRADDDMVLTPVPSTGTMTLRGLIAPGTYRLRISGSGATAYRLQVRVRPASLPRDAFEPNDSFATATLMRFEPSKGPLVPSLRREWGPGIFDATLHTTRDFLTGGRVVNPDYYQFDVGQVSVFRIPTVTISQTDRPVTVTLYDDDDRVLQSWANVRSATVLPPANTTCYLMVTGPSATRYTMSFKLRVDKDAIPGPWQEELEIFPKWWGDPPPLKLKELEHHYFVNVGVERGDGDTIVFEPPALPVTVELLDLDGNVIRQSEAVRGRPTLNTRGLERGGYLLRVAREDRDRSRSLSLRLASPIR